MIHSITLSRLPQYNNALLIKHFKDYSSNDLIAVKILNENSTYYYQVLGIGVFNSIADFVVVRTFSNNHKI